MEKLLCWRSQCCWRSGRQLTQQTQLAACGISLIKWLSLLQIISQSLLLNKPSQVFIWWRWPGDCRLSLTYLSLKSFSMANHPFRDISFSVFPSLVALSIIFMTFLYMHLRPLLSQVLLHKKRTDLRVFCLWCWSLVNTDCAWELLKAMFHVNTPEGQQANETV